MCRSPARLSLAVGCYPSGEWRRGWSKGHRRLKVAEIPHRRKRPGSRTCGVESRDRHRLRRAASTDGDERGVSAHRASAFAIVAMRCKRVSACHRHVYTSSDANPPPPLNRLALPATIPTTSSHFRQRLLLCGKRQSNPQRRRLSQSPITIMKSSAHTEQSSATVPAR